MRTSIAGILWLAVLWLNSVSCLAQVQQTLPPQKSQPSRDGGVREVLESIVIPPIPHSPFTATLATEAIKYAADGATMTFVNERHIARDEQGRIYEERWLLVPKNGNAKSTMNWIQIADPKERTLYNCSPQKHICDLLAYDPASDLAAATVRTGSSHSLPRGDGNVSWEDLGTRNILGMDTVGVRETTITKRRGHGQRPAPHQFQRILAFAATWPQPVVGAIKPILREANLHHHRVDCVRARPGAIPTPGGV